MTAFRSILLSLALALCLAPGALAADPDAIVDELRQRAQAVETFDVKMTARRIVDGEPVEPAAGHLLILGRRFKAPDHYRATAWDEDGNVVHDLTRIEGTTTSHEIREGRASISEFAQGPGEHIVFAPNLSPLLLGRVFERAELVDAEVDRAAGELTLRWEAPDAYPMDRRITATVSLGAPHELLSMTRREPKAGHEMRIEFGGPRVDGLDIPIPTEARVTSIAETGEVTREYLMTLEEVTINEPMPDSDFEIDLPPGTRVRDHRTGHSYIVGELSAAE